MRYILAIAAMFIATCAYAQVPCVNGKCPRVLVVTPTPVVVVPAKTAEPPVIVPADPVPAAVVVAPAPVVAYRIAPLRTFVERVRTRRHGK